MHTLKKTVEIGLPHSCCAWLSLAAACFAALRCCRSWSSSLHMCLCPPCRQSA